MPARGEAMRATPMRLALTFLALAYGAASLGSGIDRILGQLPAGAGTPILIAPAPFADSSLRRAAAVQLADGHDARAASLARKAVVRSPLEPLASSLLGAALLGEQNSVSADAAFRISGQLGWRDGATQTYWMQAALAAGEVAIASERLDAILRLEPLKAHLAVPSAYLEGGQEGRSALAARLANGPGWLPSYFDPGPEVQRFQLVQRAQVAQQLATRKIVGCAAIASFTRRLVAEEMIGAAQDVWRAHCPPARNALLADGDFADQSPFGRSPFAWEKFADGSLSQVPASPKGGLLLESTASFPRKVVRQLLVLKPGTYRLSWSALDAQGRPNDRITANVGCSPQGPQQRIPAAAANQRMAAEWRVTGDCEGRWLTFSLAPGNGGITFGNVRLEQVASAPR